MGMSTVTIATGDGDCPTRVFRPAGAGPWPAAIFYMDGIGIRPVLFEMAQRLADEGYVVLLPDLFYRAGPYEPVDPKVMFADSKKRDAFFGKYFASTSAAKASADTRAFLDFLDTQSDVQGKKIGATGYCMGGAMVLTAAAEYLDRVAAAASWHGGGLATDAPDSPHLKADRIKARVLVAGADQDAFYPPEMHARLEAALSAAKVEHAASIWPGALHGWTMKDLPIYNEEAAERHWRELGALFAAQLKN